MKTQATTPASLTPSVRRQRWKIAAVAISFIVLRLFLVARHNSAQVAFLEAYETNDTDAAWRSREIVESGTWSWLPFLWISKPGARAGIIRTAAYESDQSEADSLSGTQSEPSWATRKKTWLGLGSVEWTVSEKTFFGGTKKVLYRIQNGRAVEQGR